MALTDEDKEWISTRLEKLETTLLTEFHKWSSPMEQRMRSHREALRTLDMEGEQMSDTLKRVEARLKELEGK